MNIRINLKFSGDCVQSEGVLAATEVALMEAAVLLPKRISRAARTCLDNINCVGTPRVGSGVAFTEGALGFNLHIILEEGGKALDAAKFKEALEVEMGVRPRPVLPAPPLQPKVPPQTADLSRTASEESEQGVQPKADLAQERQETATETVPLVESTTHASEKGWPGHARELLAGDEDTAGIDATPNTSVPPTTLAAGPEAPGQSHNDPARHQRGDVEAPTAQTDAVMEDVVASPLLDSAAPVEMEASEDCSSTMDLPIFVSGSATKAAPVEIPPPVPADDLDQASAAVVDPDPTHALLVFNPINEGADPREACRVAEVLGRDAADHGLDGSAATTLDRSPGLVPSPGVGAERDAAQATEHLMRAHAVVVPVGAISEVRPFSDASHDRVPARHDEVVVSDAAKSCTATPVKPLESLKLAPKPAMETQIVVERCTPVTQAQLQGKGLPTLIVMVDSEEEQVERGMNFTSELVGLETRSGGIFFLAAYEVGIDTQR